MPFSPLAPEASLTDLSIIKLMNEEVVMGFPRFVCFCDRDKPQARATFLPDALDIFRNPSLDHAVFRLEQFLTVRVCGNARTYQGTIKFLWAQG